MPFSLWVPNNLVTSSCRLTCLFCLFSVVFGWPAFLGGGLAGGGTGCFPLVLRAFGAAGARGGGVRAAGRTGERLAEAAEPGAGPAGARGCQGTSPARGRTAGPGWPPPPAAANSTRDDGVRLGGEELPPGRPGPPWRGTDAGRVQGLPHRGRGDRVSQPGQFPLDPPKAPSGVLPRHPEDQRLDRCTGRRPPWPSPARVVPLAGDEVTVPAQYRGRG